MRHNHFTRDIKPFGVCPGCDEYLNGQRNMHKFYAYEHVQDCQDCRKFWKEHLTFWDWLNQQDMVLCKTELTGTTFEDHDHEWVPMTPEEVEQTYKDWLMFSFKVRSMRTIKEILEEDFGDQDETGA